MSYAYPANDLNLSAGEVFPLGPAIGYLLLELIAIFKNVWKALT